MAYVLGLLGLSHERTSAKGCAVPARPLSICCEGAFGSRLAYLNSWSCACFRGEEECKYFCAFCQVSPLGSHDVPVADISCVKPEFCVVLCQYCGTCRTWYILLFSTIVLLIGGIALLQTG